MQQNGLDCRSVALGSGAYAPTVNGPAKSDADRDGPADGVPGIQVQAFPGVQAHDHPALVICDGPGGPALAAVLRGNGWRVQAIVSPEMAAARLDMTASVRLVWMHLSEPVADALLDAIAARVDALNGCMVVDAPVGPVIDQLDAAYASNASVRILCDPTDVETQLAQYWALDAVVPAAHDDGGSAADGALVGGAAQGGATGSDRIDQLQAEVSRIARLVSQLSAQGAADLAGGYGGGYAQGPGGVPGAAGAYGGGHYARPATLPSGFQPTPGGPPSPFIEDYPAMVRAPARGFGAQPDFDGPPPSTPRQQAARIRRLIRQRRARDQFFPADLFADPAWDMLLDLYAARLERQPVSVSSLCIAAAVPATTALRWIKSMTDAGLFVREADPRDGRRIFIALSPGTAESMAQYFASVGELAGA